jgi:hypothetical protein
MEVSVYYSETTIIYCSSNREDSLFEQKVIDNILKNKPYDMPIVSITQKPMDFGINFCVGDDVGVSGFNFFRQSQIACEKAQTRFVLSCEADCFYPPDYFTWIPPRDDKCYRNSNLYVMPQYRAFFWRKPEGATHAQIINREFYLNKLNELFEGAPDWDREVKEKNFPKERYRLEDIFPKKQIEYYETQNPVIQIKTTRSMRHYTHSDRIDIHEIPYWGTGKEFRDKYYNIGYRH